MIVSLTEYELMKYLQRQLNNNFPDKRVNLNSKCCKSAIKLALERCEKCFSQITARGYHKNENAFFSHLHSDQYTTFLYYFSNSLFNLNQNYKPICDKVILLNRLLHGCWFTYKVQLPDIFHLIHPLGTILGHAHYNDYLVVFQNVTIGETKLLHERNNKFSTIGRNCLLGSGASIIGPSEIGDNVSIGIRSTVYNESIPNNTIVFTDKQTGERILKHNNKQPRTRIYFKD